MDKVRTMTPLPRAFTLSVLALSIALAPSQALQPMQAPALGEMHSDFLAGEQFAGAPSAEAVAASAATADLGAPFACASADEGRGLLVVAHPSLLTTVADAAQKQALAELWLANFEAAAALFARDALSRGEVARLRVHCDPVGVPLVQLVQVPFRANPSKATVASDLSAAGLTDRDTKYIVLYDGTAACTCTGFAPLAADDRLTSGNAANVGGQSAITLLGKFTPEDYGLLYLTLLHELAHTMGAVQGSAPHSSGAGHCNDGVDIMCYADGGSRSNYVNDACPAPQQTASVGDPFDWPYHWTAVLDCNGDDYFNPHPPAGGYLCNHWNVGSRLNRFVQFDAPAVVPPGACY